MHKVIDHSNKETWSELAVLIKDPFYTWEFASAFSYIGRPKLFFYGDDYDFVVVPFILREINIPPGGNLHDITSHYGYAGPACFGKPNLKEFIKEWDSFLKTNNIVSEFTRLHPLLENHEIFPWTEKIGDTVFVNLEKKIDMSDFDKRCRNSITKAQRDGVKVGNMGCNIDHFITLYYKTMERHGTESRYFFPGKSIKKLLDINGTTVLYAMLGDKVIASAIFLYYDGGKYAYYYLAGSDDHYKNHNPNNLIVYEAMKYFKGLGCKGMCLGGDHGGSGTLFNFKASFSTLRKEYYVNKKIVMKEAYDKLSEGKSRDFFPAYRGSDEIPKGQA